MTDSPFGPAYTKINTLWKRDPARKNTIIPGDFSQEEHRYLYDNMWFWCRKVDGCNIRLFWDGEKVTIGGRTDNAQIPAHLTQAIIDKGYTNPDKWREIFPDTTPETGGVTVFGEGYGPKIQKGGGLYREDPDFVAFDVLAGRWWLKRPGVEEVTVKLGMEIVPEYGYFSLREAWDRTWRHDLEPLRWTDAPVEGMVGVPAIPLSDRRGGRIIVKVKIEDVEAYKRAVLENGEGKLHV
jgi:hypothetical protein